jgi:hypothetical protein
LTNILNSLLFGLELAKYKKTQRSIISSRVLVLKKLWNNKNNKYNNKVYTDYDRNKGAIRVNSQIHNGQGNLPIYAPSLLLNYYPFRFNAELVNKTF